MLVVRDYNSILGVPDRLAVSIDSYPANATTAAPGFLSIALDVEAVNDAPLLRLNTNADNPALPRLGRAVVVEGKWLNLHEGGAQGSTCPPGADAACFSIADADICEAKFLAPGKPPPSRPPPCTPISSIHIHTYTYIYIYI